MRLHYRHLVGDGLGVRPLRCECSATSVRPQRLQELSRFAVEAAEECGDDPSAGSIAWSGNLNHDSLVISSTDGFTLTVPLLFSEIAHAPVGRGSSLSVIVLAPARVPSTDADQQEQTGTGVGAWVFVVEGDATLHRQLCALSERGAVRGDLREEFLVAAKPFSSGASASVHQARAVREQARGNMMEGRFAAKVIAADFKEAEVAKVDAEVELLILAQGHPNIIRFCGLFACGVEKEDKEEREGVATDPFRQPCQVVLTDLCRKGDLYGRVKRRGPYKEMKALELAGQLLSALVHIHDRGLVHRDIKSENILIGNDRQAILTDFGIAARLTDTEAMKMRCGTPGYVAPEVLSGPSYGKKVDVFGTGIVLYFALLATTPFDPECQEDVTAILDKTVECCVSFPSHATVSAQMKQFILKLVKKDPEERLTAKNAEDVVKLLGALPANGAGGAAFSSSSHLERAVVVEPEEALPPEEERPTAKNAEDVVKLLGALPASGAGGAASTSSSHWERAVVVKPEEALPPEKEQPTAKNAKDVVKLLGALPASGAGSAASSSSSHWEGDVAVEPQAALPPEQASAEDDDDEERCSFNGETQTEGSRSELVKHKHKDWPRAAQSWSLPMGFGLPRLSRRSSSQARKEHKAAREASPSADDASTASASDSESAFSGDTHGRRQARIFSSRIFRLFGGAPGRRERDAAGEAEASQSSNMEFASEESRRSCCEGADVPKLPALSNTHGVSLSSGVQKQKPRHTSHGQEASPSANMGYASVESCSTTSGDASGQHAPSAAEVSASTDADYRSEESRSYTSGSSSMRKQHGLFSFGGLRLPSSMWERKVSQPKDEAFASEESRSSSGVDSGGRKQSSLFGFSGLRRASSTRERKERNIAWETEVKESKTVPSESSTSRSSSSRNSPLEQLVSSRGTARSSFDPVFLTEGAPRSKFAGGR